MCCSYHLQSGLAVGELLLPNRRHWCLSSQKERSCVCDRCNVAAMLSGLPYIVAVLLDNGQALQALPVIALLEWLAQHIWADLAATVAVRLQRAQALTHLGLLAEATTVLGALMQVCTPYHALFISCRLVLNLLSTCLVHHVCQFPVLHHKSQYDDSW